MASIAARRRVVSHLKLARRQTFTPGLCPTSSSFPVSASFGSSTASSAFLMAYIVADRTTALPRISTGTS